MRTNSGFMLRTMLNLDDGLSKTGSLRISLGSLVCWVADQGSYLGAVTEQLQGSGLSLNVLSIVGETVKGQFYL